MNLSSLELSAFIDCSQTLLHWLCRFLALVQPFQLTSWRTRYKTICINLGLWAASFILVLPVWVYSKVIKFKDSAESCAFDLTSPHDTDVRAGP